METISKEDLALYKEMFNSFDDNRDGKLSVKELGKFVRSLGQNPTEDDLRHMVKEIDTDGNGYIEFSEFVRIFEGHIKDTETELREAFETFDKDKSGKLSASELRLVLTKLGEKLSDEEVNEMLKYGDVDGDGEISYEEFVQMMSGKR